MHPTNRGGYEGNRGDRRNPDGRVRRGMRGGYRGGYRGE